MTARRLLCRALPPLALLLLLPGCWAVEGAPAYHLAQGCHRVTSAAGVGSLRAAEDGSYGLDDSAPDHFFLKPTGLGTFLLYDQGGGYLAADGDTVRRRATADDRAEWSIRQVEVVVPEDARIAGPQVTLSAAAGNGRLTAAVDGLALRGRLVAGLGMRAAWRLEAQPAESCAAFPEASLDAVVAPDFHEPRDAEAPIVGFADLHAHLGFPKALGAMAMAGGVVHRFGIEHALADCDALHGADGSLDLLGSQTGSGAHDTSGYPEFAYWPNRHSTTHIQAYYRWIERAFLSGLRLVVTLATGNRSLCQALGQINPSLLEGDCTPANTVELQTRYIYEIQDYVDAQAGGPGKGWFRVVTSPTEARAAIAANQLAVVLGVEYGELFDCRDEGSVECTPAHVDRELALLHALGVRSVFPIHRFDNSFGGTRIQDGDAGAWMNLANKLSTTGVDHFGELLTPDFQGGGDFWQVQECPDGVEGTGGVRDMREFAESLSGVNPLFQLFELFGVLEKLEPIPDYADVAGSDRLCNPRTLQPIGEYLLHRLIDRGMIIEIDHLSPETLFATLDLIEERGYSGLVSSHSWLENQSAVRQRIFALGGLMSPFNGSPSGIAATIETYAAEMAAHPHPVGVATGTDIQGVTSQASGDAGRTTTYPFSSVDGRVSFLPPVTGDRHFDFDTEGIAHYGLLPEWVEQLRQADEDTPAEVMGAFMNSAEAYVSMWERALASAR